jgi:hypothetical protein
MKALYDPFSARGTPISPLRSLIKHATDAYSGHEDPCFGERDDLRKRSGGTALLPARVFLSS